MDGSELASSCVMLTAGEPMPLMLAIVLRRLGSTDPTLRDVCVRKLQLVSSTLSAAAQASLEAELSFRFQSLPPQPTTAHRSLLATKASNIPSLKTTPLSQCDALWTRTSDYYIQQRASAWTDGHVPYHISSSAFVAARYASVIETFLTEVSDGSASTASDGMCYVLDVGCGCGVLGVQVAHELRRHGRRDVCVVLADIDETAALAQAALPRAAGLVADGMLDVARLDGSPNPSEASPSLHLLLSGKTLSPNSIHKLCLLCNYLVDSLPVDVFRVAKGGSTDALLPLDSGGKEEGARFIYKRIEAASSHHDPREKLLFERLMDRATQDAEAAGNGVGVALVPTGAARLIWWLDRFRSPLAPLLLLIGDKMVDHDTLPRLVRADATGRLALHEIPLFDVHGDRKGPISCCVDADAIAEVVDLCCTRDTNNGAGAAMARRELGRTLAMSDFDVRGIALAPRELDASRAAFERGLGTFGPADLERLHAFVQEREDAPLAMLTGLLRLECYDWQSFVSLRWQLVRRLRSCTRKREAVRALKAAYRCYRQRSVLDRREWVSSRACFAAFLRATRCWWRLAT